MLVLFPFATFTWLLQKNLHVSHFLQRSVNFVKTSSFFNMYCQLSYSITLQHHRIPQHAFAYSERCFTTFVLIAKGGFWCSGWILIHPEVDFEVWYNFVVVEYQHTRNFKLISIYLVHKIINGLTIRWLIF